MVKQVSSNASMNSLVDLGVLLLFAIAFSYIMINIFGSHQPSLSEPDWKGARWIKAGETSGNGYFRKNFALSSLPHKAYLVIAGTEELSIYVNTNNAGLRSFSGARPSTILDVTKLLHIGNNLLAIKVNSNIYGVAPQLISRLVIISAGGMQSEIHSDGSWRASRKKGYQKAGKADWFSPDYHDIHWLAATEVLENIHTLPLPVPEYVYATFPKGYWIWSGKNELATLSNEFMVEGKEIRDAWLGVSTEGRYSLFVNGISVTSIRGTGKTMEILDISPYLQLGKNNMWLQVENKLIEPRVLISGSVTSDINTVDLDSGPQWSAVPSTGVLLGSVHEKVRLIESKPITHISTSRLRLAYKDVTYSAMLSTMHILFVLVISLVVLAILLMSFLIFAKFARYKSNNTMEECFNLFTKPFVLGLILLSVSLLLKNDPRLTDYLLYQFYALLIVPFVIVFFEIVILLEIHSEEESLDGN